jgi:hypothetical protein
MLELMELVEKHVGVAIYCTGTPYVVIGEGVDVRSYRRR